MPITLNIHLPDDLVAQLAVGGRDLERAALEAFAVEEYRAKRITPRSSRATFGSVSLGCGWSAKRTRSLAGLHSRRF